jgi:hypothetical protein
MLVGKLKRKRALVRLRCRWEDDIRIGLIEIGWEGVEWMHLVHDRDQWWVLVSTVMNLQVS